MCEKVIFGLGGYKSLAPRLINRFLMLVASAPPSLLIQVMNFGHRLPCKFNSAGILEHFAIFCYVNAILQGFG